MQFTQVPPIDSMALARFRRVAGLSTRQLGKRANISASMIARIESGSREPSLRVMAALAGALGVGIEDLLNRERTALWAASVAGATLSPTSASAGEAV